MQPQDPEASKLRDHLVKAESSGVFVSGDGHDDDVDDDASEMRETLSVNERLSLMTRI